MSCQQKPFSLFALQASPSWLWYCSTVTKRFPGHSILSADLSAWKISNSNLDTSCKKSEGTNIWHLISGEFINTVYDVISCVRNTFVLLAFFLFSSLTWLTYSRHNRCQRPSCCSITVPLYPHCLGPVTTRAVCAPCVRVTVSAERGETSLTLSSLRYQGLHSQCLLSCEKDRKIVIPLFIVL